MDRQGVVICVLSIGVTGIQRSRAIFIDAVLPLYSLELQLDLLHTFYAEWSPLRRRRRRARLSGSPEIDRWS